MHPTNLTTKDYLIQIKRNAVLQELEKKEAFKTEELTGKSITFYVQSRLFTVSGKWDWEGHMQKIFCSDVIADLPSGFEGTRAIIHPDDLAGLMDRLDSGSGLIGEVDFRIITSYGEIKQLFGKRLFLVEEKENKEGIESSVNRLLEIEEQKKQIHNLQLIQHVYEKAERFTSTGVWYFNSATTETYYSPEIFRIFDLPNQGLNAHLHTFQPFIHPDDRELVIQFMDKAFRERVPLHIDYRIHTAQGVKFVQHTTHWFNDPEGSEILSGTIQDITETRNTEITLEHAVEESSFFRQQLSFDEQYANLAHWHVNLVTRKTVYSDNFYRMFGLKPLTHQTGLNGFINYIHPEDREAVIAANKKMIHEHLVPEIEFRIIRGEGKLRYVSQKGKLISVSGELTVAGTIQDVTVQRMLEKRISQQNAVVTMDKSLVSRAEEVSNVATSVISLDDGTITWSDNFYRLVGLKPQAIELTQKLFFSYIHPDDLKKYKEETNLVITEKTTREFEFRILQRGAIRYVNALVEHKIIDDAGYLFIILQDRTEFFLLKQQLDKRTQLAEALSEYIIDRVVITNADHCIIAWNRSCEEIYGLKKDEVIGRNFFDVFPKLKTEKEIQLFNRAFKGEKITQLGYHSTMGTGYFDLHMVPMWDENKEEVLGVIHIVHDVTREIELRQSLSERLNFIESLIESSIDRIIALDRNMNYLYWNKNAEAHYGVAKEEVVGKNIMEVFPNLVNDPTYTQFRLALKGELVHIPFNQDVREKIYTETYLIPIKNERGEVAGVLWLVHDLSERFIALEEISSRQRLLEAAFSTSNLAMVVADSVRDAAENIIDFEFRLVNEVFTRIAGKDMSGLRLRQTGAPGCDEYIFDQLKAVVENDKAAVFNFSHDLNGHRSWYHLSAVKLNNGIFFTLEDITERKKGEEIINKTLTLLEESEQLAGIGSWEYDIASKTFTWSEGMYRLFGLEIGTRISPSVFLDYAVAEDKHIAMRIQDCLENKPGSFEETLRINSGTQKILKIKGKLIPDKWGEPVKILGTDLDITGIRQAESRMKESQELLQQSTRATPDSITIYNLHTGEPVYLNDRLSHWTGYSNEELVTMGREGRLQLIHPDDRQRLLHFNKGFLEVDDDDVHTVEYRLCSGKNTTWIRNRSKIFKRDASGVPIQILSVLQDFSAEVKLRNELKDRTWYAESIIDASIDRISVFDSSMNIIAWNRQAEEATGLAKQDVLGKNLFEKFPELEKNKVLYHAHLDALAGNHIHLPPSRETGSDLYYENYFLPLKNGQGITYAVVNIMHDVSHMVLHQVELQELNYTLEEKNRELQERNEEITSFAFVASHDLKEPLRKILTFSDWLVERELQDMPATAKNYFDKINSAVYRIESLIDDIMVLSKIHSDEGKHVKVDLSQILDRVRTEMSDQLTETGVVIESDPLPIVKGNPNQLFYLFHNIIDNAVKFRKKGVQPVIQIQVDHKASSKENQPSGKPVIISFTDNGIGFDRKYSKKIFGVFQRLHPKSEYEGTGMGLAICKKIMDNHRGRIHADSEQGTGSTVTCFFPDRD